MIHVVGLGPGDPGLLTLSAWEALCQAEHIVLRTGSHGAAAYLQNKGIDFTTYDCLYESKGSFSEVYEAIVVDLLQRAGSGSRLVYAVPGHPLVAERTVELLIAEAKKSDITVDIIPGMSSVEAVYAELKVDPAQGVAVVDALDPEMFVDPRLGLVVTQVFSRLVAGDLKLKLLDVYPAEHRVVTVRCAGTSARTIRTTSLAELDHYEFSYADTVYIPPCSVARHAGMELEILRVTMERLRSDRGCPWDREQTHSTLKSYLVEEAYEVIEAIDEQNADKLAEELGDLLLQIVFHAQIAAETGDFVLADSIRLINEKLVRRHPHVFSGVKVDNSNQVAENWQRIKQEEKKGNYDKSVLASVPKDLPALQQAYKVQARAKRVGFDWPSIDGALQKLQEELRELEVARQEDNIQSIHDELGDVLFSMVNVSRFLGVDPENSLRDSVGKFRRRFALVEKAAEQRGIVLSECSLEELDKLWDEVKLVES
ncbi:MAG: MazG family protein [Bacillota bacterium]|nr:MAG: MazG family protein [Bacillota bacterium]MBS3950604.1 nucleoside triphosphate pyrophosphohydrolase [Peptococcaceae bacterium]